MERRNAYGFPEVVCDLCADPLGTVIVREIRGNTAFDFHFNCYIEFCDIIKEKSDEKKAPYHASSKS